MIGKVKVVGNIRHCIEYGLHDKRELSEEQKIDLSLLDGLQHKDRAEVLVMFKCAGDAQALTEQFSEVARLSKRVEKPLFHASLRLAPTDSLTPEQWIEVGTAWAEEFKVQNNQYLIILHKDTLPPHIHLVANRVGFDGKVASDSNDFRRIANFCRMMEQRFNLTKVPNPRRFLRKDQQAVPRHDQRKLNLKFQIHEALRHAISFDQFKERMQYLGFEVIKGRGITFVDDKKVRMKGSEVGYSLANIEKMLSLNNQIAMKITEVNNAEKVIAMSREILQTLPAAIRIRVEAKQHPRQVQWRLLNQELAALEKAATKFWTDLFKVEYVPSGINIELIKEAKRKKKKKRSR
jgi:DNA-binding transcriptional MerR regulator